MPALFSVATSIYTKAPLWAVVVEDSGAFSVVNASGSRNENQERRIERLLERARKTPSAPEDIIKLALVNASSIALSAPVEAESVDEAQKQAIEALKAAAP